MKPFARIMVVVVLAGAVILIIGGTIVASLKPKLPFMIALKYGGGIECGGVLLNEQWVLTAAHCVFGKVATDFKVEAHTTFADTIWANERAVASACVDPSYDEAADPLVNDLAVMKLVKSFGSVEGAGFGPLVSTTVTAVGWNRDVGGSQLYEVTVPYVDWATCNKDHQDPLFNGHIKAGHICFGEAGKGVCRGDSGGPLLDPSTGQVVGVISDSPKSCVQAKSWATAVRVDLTWIEMAVAGKAKCK